MKVAYVCHHTRPNYEYAWFAALPVDEVVFLTTEGENDTGDQTSRINVKPTDGSKVRNFKVDYEERGWQNRFFHSTARRVTYSNFEECIKDVDVVVVLEVFSTLSKQFVEYCRKIHKPVVVLVYELIAEHPVYKLPHYRRNTRYCLRHADQFVAISRAASAHLQKLGADSAKISVIYPGINLDIFRPNRKGRIDAGLISVGILERHKGIDLILEVYERLLPEFPNLPLTIISPGSWRPQVEALAATNPHVTYHVVLPNAEVAATYNKRGVYIMPARDTKRLGMRIGAEQFSFSVVEAMACGLAIVTSRCGALPEIVTAKNVITPQGDSEALYQQTRALLKNTKRLTELSSYNEQLARQRYDIKRQAAALAEVLETVVKKAKIER